MSPRPDPPPRRAPVVVIHGGAGTLARADFTPEKAAAYRAALEAVLVAAQVLLARGASAVEVVVEAVRQLEECPLFNAGFGSVYTACGEHELDACVMRGHDRAAGAVAGVRTLRNPVLAARAVLEAGGPVLLVGAGAEAFAAAHGCEQVAPDWFGTPERLAQLQAAQAAGAVVLDHDRVAPATAEDDPVAAAAAAVRPGDTAPAPAAPMAAQAGVGGAALAAAGDAFQSAGTRLGTQVDKYGTVGAVALDANGHLAAATSTGGMTGKPPGRVGDSPLVGAGCYAHDRTVAVSCTGAGEAFIRALAGHELSALIEHAGLTLADAAHRVVWQTLPPLGGRGGLIAVDACGDIALPFNTDGMYRGFARVGGPVVTAIFGDEPIGGHDHGHGHDRDTEGGGGPESDVDLHGRHGKGRDVDGGDGRDRDGQDRDGQDRDGRDGERRIHDDPVRDGRNGDIGDIGPHRPEPLRR